MTKIHFQGSINPECKTNILLL